MFTFKNTDSRKDISFVSLWKEVRRPGIFASVPWLKYILEKLKTHEFDVLVIGGGCTGIFTSWRFVWSPLGAYCALDAAKRGFSVALVEQEDFASGTHFFASSLFPALIATSSRSTNLLHGGIRYLEQAFTKMDPKSLSLVTEALHERTYMLNEAPYLTKGIPTVMPLYAYWRIPYVWIGCKMYDIIAGKSCPLPRSRYINKKEIGEFFPHINKKGLKGGILYWIVFCPWSL